MHWFVCMYLFVCVCMCMYVYELLIYSCLVLTFYVHTICLTPNSRFIFVLGCGLTFIHSRVCMCV